MKRLFLPVILLTVLCIGCNGITVELPNQPVVEEEIFVPDLPCCPTKEVLFFTMPGCLPCEKARPQIEEMREQGLKVTEVDIYENPELAHQYQITQTPTFILLEDGIEIERTSSIIAIILTLVKILAWILPLLLS